MLEYVKFLFSIQGEYGLAEAVAEIKDWKVKVSVRDRYDFK